MDNHCISAKGSLENKVAMPTCKCASVVQGASRMRPWVSDLDILKYPLSVALNQDERNKCNGNDRW